MLIKIKNTSIGTLERKNFSFIYVNIDRKIAYSYITYYIGTCVRWIKTILDRQSELKISQTAYFGRKFCKHDNYLKLQKN